MKYVVKFQILIDTLGQNLTTLLIPLQPFIYKSKWVEMCMASVEGICRMHIKSFMHVSYTIMEMYSIMRPSDTCFPSVVYFV